MQNASYREDLCISKVTCLDNLIADSPKMFTYVNNGLMEQIPKASFGVEYSFK